MKKINKLYYDAMDLLSEGYPEEAIKLLQEALIIDINHVETYVGLVGAYSMIGNDEKRVEVIKIAFDKTRQKFTEWPKEMLWGYMENRQYLRAIQYRGDLYWDDGELESAKEIFKLLLKLNPGDNQGVRYEIAGVYAGLSGNEINKMFDEGNEKQNWNKLERLVQEQNKIHNFL
jgi:tetratricopeptide (TPR) repeat protein